MANYNLDIIGACEKVRVEAENLAGENYAYEQKRKTGALDFITAPENGGVDASLISYDKGRKIARMRLLYDQRTKPCQIITDCDSNVCDEGSTPLRKEAIVSIGNCLKTPVREYSNDDLVALCKDSKEFMRSRMMSDIRAGQEKFSELLLAALDNEIGVNVGWNGTPTTAGNYRTTQLIKNGSPRIPLVDNFGEVMLDYETNQLVGTPAIIGQGNIELFWKLHGWSCCNASTPYGEANLTQEARFYLDQAGNSILGTNKFILATFGSVRLLTFNENRNINFALDNEAHIVIPDPLYPFDWNFDMYFDKCDKVWKSQLSLVWGTFNKYQADSFAGDGDGDSPDTSPDCDDELEGMLGVFGYEATAGS